MRRELIIKSKSLAGTSDLTLLAPIKKGLVPSLDTISHKSRIKRLLQTLGAGRGNSQEYALLRPFSDAVERVGKIHSVRVAVLEPENKVLLAVTFDGSWEAYIRVLWQKVGTLLDIIFFDTEDYVSAFDNRFEAWEAWCRRVQVETHFYYGTPGLTVDDVRYLRHEEFLHRQSPGKSQADVDATRYSVETPEQLSWKAAAKTSGATALETLKQGLEALAALYRLTDLYLPTTEDGLFLRRAARDLLLEFVAMLAKDEFPVDLLTLAKQRFDKQLAWLRQALPAPKNPRRGVPPLPAVRPEFDASDVQGGIIRPYEKTTHGCLLLLAIEDGKAAVEFLDHLIKALTRESKDALQDGETAVNVAITYEGLRRIGLSEAELERYPEEFREGMEVRASSLGDLRTNHPRRWHLPRRYPRRSDPSAEMEAKRCLDRSEQIELVEVHVVVQLRVRGKPGVNTLRDSDVDYMRQAEFDAWPELIERSGMALLAVQQMQRILGASGQVQEHFGFADGGSDPIIDPAPPGSVYSNQVHLGEILRGYANEADWAPEPDSASRNQASKTDWFKNGSFLVIRKLAQDVAALETALTKAAAGGPGRQAIVEKMMGRKKDGKPLAKLAKDGSTNNFNYQDDKEGLGCPLHAHIRRTNPRVGALGINEQTGRRTPRLVRRGMSYGSTESQLSQERGLVFMAYNASIAEQFEVVQRWISGGNSTGGYSGQSDPFLGVPEYGKQRVFRYEEPEGNIVAVPLEATPVELEQCRPFVKLQWGAYLFAPSVSALGALRDVLETHSKSLAAGPRETPWSVEEGNRKIQEMLASKASAKKWKEALEDPIEVEKFRSAGLWSAIRRFHGGALRTPYGVLVADEALALQVLRSGEKFSVSGYRARLEKSIGAIYLGEDEGEEYKRLCGPVNAAIMAIERDDAFRLSFETTRQVMEHEFLAVARRFANPVDPGRWELILEIKEVIDKVLGKICQQWFGLPEATNDIRLEGSRWDADPRCALYPGHFTAPSRYVFQPRPGKSAKEFGCQYGQIVTAGFSRFLESATANRTWPPKSSDGKETVAKAIWRSFAPTNDLGLITRTLVGAMMGFLPTVDGNLRRSLAEWLYEGTFWTMRTRWQHVSESDRTLNKADEILLPPLLRAMQLRPSPELIWRTATGDTHIGPIKVRKGEIVVVGIASAAQARLTEGDDEHYMLFGGNRRDPKTHPPTHACPGYEAALGVMLGFIAGLLNTTESMRPSAVPMALTFEGPFAPIAKTREERVAEQEAEKMRAAESERQLKGLLKAPDPRAGPPPEQASPPWVIGLGDSWFHYFAIDIFDVLQEQRDFQVVSLAREGVGLLALHANPDQLVRLSRQLEQMSADGMAPAAILLSAGGDDVVAPTLRTLLAPYGQKPELLDAEVEQLVNGHMKPALETTIERIEAVCKKRLARSIPIVLHGYDYPHPDGRYVDGSKAPAWLWPDFQERGYGDNETSARAATTAMHDLIDKLNEMQIDVVAQRKDDLVFHVDLRNILKSKDYKDDWGNELHPTRKGFEALAAKLAEKTREAIARHASHAEKLSSVR